MKRSNLIFLISIICIAVFSLQFVVADQYCNVNTCGQTVTYDNGSCNVTVNCPPCICGDGVCNGAEVPCSGSSCNNNNGQCLDCGCAAGKTQVGSQCCTINPPNCSATVCGSQSYADSCGNQYTVTCPSCAIGGVCGAAANTCVSGTPTGDNGATCGTRTWTCEGINGGNSAGCVLAQTACPLNCTLPWGGVLVHGASVTAYAAATTACPNGCAAETRTCNNGVLSGTYTSRTCTAGACSYGYVTSWGSCPSCSGSDCGSTSFTQTGTQRCQRSDGAYVTLNYCGYPSAVSSRTVTQDCTRNCGTCNDGSCFKDNTLVSTPAGDVEIATIKPGDLVYAFDEKTEQQVVVPVSAFEITYRKEQFNMTMDDETSVLTTYDHAFLTLEKGWAAIDKQAGSRSAGIPVNSLTAGDSIKGIDKTRKIVSITKIPESSIMYTLIMPEPYNNFYAGKLLAHNCNDRGGDACFVAGTKVLMADGSQKNIEAVKRGDKITVYDERTGEKSTSEVFSAPKNSAGDQYIYTIVLTDGTEVVPNELHQFYETRSGKYVSAKELERMFIAKEQPLLKTSEGKEIGVRSMKKELMDVPVYNLRLKGLEKINTLDYPYGVGYNYYANGVLVSQFMDPKSKTGRAKLHQGNDVQRNYCAAND